MSIFIIYDNSIEEKEIKLSYHYLAVTIDVDAWHGGPCCAQATPVGGEPIGSLRLRFNLGNGSGNWLVGDFNRVNHERIAHPSIKIGSAPRFIIF